MKDDDDQGAPRFNANDYMPDANDAPMEAGTLSGDIRDLMLTHIRSMNVPWHHLNEDEQRDKIMAIASASHDLVRRVVAVVAASKFPTLTVGVGAIKIDKGVEIKLGAAATIENIHALAEHGKGSAVLVLAEASNYFGERAAAKPDKDQKNLPGVEGED